MNAMKYILFVSSLTVLSIQLTSGQWIQSLITEFKDGELGPMGAPCLGHDLLEVKKYEDFEGYFEKPFGANEYFIAASEGIYEYCMETVGTFLVSDYGYELYITVYTINTGGELRTFRWSAIDIKNFTEITTVVDIDDSRTWTNSTIKITSKSSYKIRLEYTSSGENDVFFAIDKFVLIYPDDYYTTTDEPTVNTSEPTVNTDEPTVNTDEPTVNTGEPTVNTDEPTVNTGETTVNTGEPTVNTGEPTVNTGEPTTVTDEPTTYEATTTTGETTTVTDEPTTTWEPTIVTDEPTTVTDEPTTTPESPLPDSCTCNCNCNYYCDAP